MATKVISTTCHISTLRPESILPGGAEAAFFQAWNEPATHGRGVTVCVCTCRRPDSLIRLLDSLEKFEGTGYPTLIVDASPDLRTEDAVRSWVGRGRMRSPLAYFRVEPAMRGLTKQRNFALRVTATDLICFFDDDVELLSDCVREMERVFRGAAGKFAGVGALVVNQPRRPVALWRMRRALGMTANLRPGTYHGSGISVPWGYVRDSDGVVEGQWLPGAAMLWDVWLARKVGFCEEFSGYSQAEDLDFSLRMGQTRKLAVTTAARVLHFQVSTGRERHFPLGYMAIRNRYYVHRRKFVHHRALYVLWFAYAWSLDTAMLIRNLRSPGLALGTMQHMAGRLVATCELLFGRRDLPITSRPSING